MRFRNLGDERLEFERRHRGRGVMVPVTEWNLLAALERGLGLRDDQMIVGLREDFPRRGWSVFIIGPEFPEVEQGVEAPRANIVIQETRIEGGLG